MSTPEKPFTVFGYGSLIFKPPPHTIKSTPGYLKGYVRRFAQMSHDHRGTPESPGRVVTLIHKEDWDHFSGSDAFPDEDIVWGIAYEIDPVYVAEVREYLDYREKDGYSLVSVDVFGLDEIGVPTVLVPEAYCYVGRNDNPSFIGSEPLDVTALTIWSSVGPSGPNKEYFYNLVEAVHKLSPDSHDSHLYALEAKIRALDNQGQPQNAD